MKKRRDLLLPLAALALLLASALWFFLSSRGAQERREAALKGLPQFPAPGQPQHARRPAPIAPRPAPPAPPPPPAAKRGDPMTAFVLAPARTVGVVSVNALFNTPLFDRLRACMPSRFAAIDKLGDKFGIDISRDVDRVAILPEGEAISGFFEGKPVAQAMLGGGSDLQSRDYRGQTILETPGRCAAQMGNLIVLGQGRDKCEALVDRALTPPPEGAADQLYGDLFLKTDLSKAPLEEMPPELRNFYSMVDGVTARANVWDNVALSVETTAKSGHSATELSQMAQGAISAVKTQLDDEDVELKALAELAKVSSNGGKLTVDLALPAKDLLQLMHFPCEGQDAGP